jgi:hypothetical protein
MVLYLTSGKADYLSGRYTSATWDLGQVERDWKEKIVTENGLVNKTLTERFVESDDPLPEFRLVMDGPSWWDARPDRPCLSDLRI